MMIIRRNLCCRVLTLAGLLICSFLFCRPALAESQRLGSRWALIIDTDSGNPEASAELARTLRVSFGFSPERVIVLLDAEATEPAIQSAMSSLGERIAPSDTLFVHLSSRIVQQEEGVYLFPSGSDLKLPWTWLQMRDFFGWLHHLPTEATLITYPWCPPTSRKFSYQDLLFEELLYQKRPGPLEFLEVCDFSVARTVRGKGHVQEPGVGVFPEEESAPSRRRAFTVALASLLHKYGKGRRTLTGEQIARQLESSLEGFALSIRKADHVRGRFGFTPSPSEIAAFRERYTEAESQGDREAALYSLVRTARERQVPRTETIGFLKQTAIDEDASLPPDQVSADQRLGLRLLAVEGLSLLATGEARAALAEIFQATSSPTVRRAAVSQISRFSDPREAERATIRLALRDEDPSVRETAVRAAVVVQNARAADAIVALLRSESNERVLIAALQSLSALGRQPDRAPVQGLLQHNSPEVRSEAAAALGSMRSDQRTTAALLERILDPQEDDRVRQAAGYSLGRALPEAQEERDRLVAGLIPIAQDGPDSVRQAVAFSLGRLGGSTAEQRLLLMFGVDNPESVRIAAAEAVGELRSELAMKVLRQAAKDDSPGMRRAAVAALGRIGNDAAIEILLASLDDPDPYVRSEAERAIHSLRRSAVDVFLQSIHSSSSRVRREAVEKLAGSGDPAAVDWLIGVLNDHVTEVRQAAVAGLSRYTDPESVEKVSMSLKHEDFRTRQGAVAVLDRISSSQVIPALLEASVDPTSSAVRIEAIRALGRRSDPRAEAAVLQATKDAHSEVRAAAAESLGRMEGEEPFQRLMRLTVDDSREVRRAAFEALTIHSRKKVRKK